jgi:hypothetical protein
MANNINKFLLLAVIGFIVIVVTVAIPNIFTSVDDDHVLSNTTSAVNNGTYQYGTELVKSVFNSGEIIIIALIFVFIVTIIGFVLWKGI